MVKFFSAQRPSVPHMQNFAQQKRIVNWLYWRKFVFVFRSDNKCDTIQTEILKNRCELKQQIKNAHRLLVFDLLVLGTRSGVTR